MKYLLDTDICVYWLKGNNSIEQKALLAGIDNIWVSFITLSELYYGDYKSQRVKENLKAIGILLDKLEVIKSSYAIFVTFGELKSSLEKGGNPIDDADIFIASCAIVNDAAMVTNNEKHFRRIEGLRIENWIK